MQYKTGDIFHCRSYGLIGRGIRWATKSQFNHSAIFIEIWGQGYIIDSQRKGTNLIPFEEWEKKWGYEYVVHRNPYLTDYKKLAIRALSKSGNTAYDFGSLLFRQPLKILTGKWRERPDKTEKRMYCSEFVAWCFKIHSYYRTTPQDLYDFCIKNNFIEIVK
jgi:hypothetical protein